MIDYRDKADFSRLREPTLEDYALPPRFLRGDPKRERPFRPVGDERADSRASRPLVLSVSVVELVGLASFAATIGFILGYYCAFVR